MGPKLIQKEASHEITKLPGGAGPASPLWKPGSCCDGQGRATCPGVTLKRQGRHQLGGEKAWPTPGPGDPARVHFNQHGDADGPSAGSGCQHYPLGSSP